MYTLVRKTETEKSFSKAETFDTFDSALKAFYQYLSNNVADATVARFDIIILNDNLIPCKEDHYFKEMVADEE